MPTKQAANKEFMEIYRRQVDTVYRICYSFMKNPADAEDLVQETFLKLLSMEKQFENERHERAWLIVTASNLCKDSLRKWWRKNEDIDDYDHIPANQQEDSMLSYILALPAEYKDAVYLYYYEGYTTGEIAKLCRTRESTVRSRLSRARKQLKTMMGGGGK